MCLYKSSITGCGAMFDTPSRELTVSRLDCETARMISDSSLFTSYGTFL